MKYSVKITREGQPASEIAIGDVLASLDGYLPESKRVIIVTDSNLHRLYRDTIEAYDHVIIGLGETNKNLATIERVYAKLIELNADRDCFLLGFGGGIVTDVTGFVASTFMRGLRFGFVATTLLAQVDASVGGKNGVNVEGYKNMAGTFDQPDFVLCDIPVLKKLPDREFRAGLAEMIKAGIISDPALFSLFENHTYEEFRDDDLLTRAIVASVNVKADIVSRDEREKGERRKLNLGHTFAHAIEKTSGTYLHGEAVSMGLVMASDLAVKAGILDEGSASRIHGVLLNAGLPVACEVDRKRIFKALVHDKKREGENINIALPASIGDCTIVRMPLGELERLMGI